MRWLRYILLALLLSSCCISAAGQDSLAVRSKPSGFDAGNMISARRYRAQAGTVFRNEKFSDNLYIAASGGVRTPLSSDYGFSSYAGVALLKWFAPSFGLRMNVHGGYMYGNHEGNKIPELSASASVMFNLSSYIGGYNRSRFCEVSALVGAGYKCRWETSARHLFAADVGVNVAMRFTDRLVVSLEPYIPVEVGASGLNYGFGTGVSLSCDLSENVCTPASAGRYFVSLSGGLQLQNSATVREAGTGKTIGYNAFVGFGRHFADYFSLRFSRGFSRHYWTVYYGGLKMPADYYTLRLEGILDIARLILGQTYAGRFGAGVVLGPEAGFMKREDVGYVLKRHYVGLSLGAHADCRLFNRVSLFVEPRFSVIPYTAPNDDSTSNNVNRNYFDSLFNFNVGLEINL